MLGLLAPSTAADPREAVQGGATGAGRTRPRGRFPITWQANMALLGPFQQGALPLPTVPEECAGREAVEVQAQHPAAVTGQAGPPDHGQAAVGGLPHHGAVSESQASGGRGWELRGPSSGTALMCWGWCLGPGGEEKGPRLAHLPHSLVTPLPARPQAIQLYRREDKGQGRADPLGCGERSGPAERLLQLLAGRWVPGAGKWGLQRAGCEERERAAAAAHVKGTQRHQTQMQTSALRPEPGCSPAPPGSCPVGGGACRAGPHMSQQPAMQ